MVAPKIDSAKQTSGKRFLEQINCFLDLAKARKGCPGLQYTDSHITNKSVLLQINKMHEYAVKKEVNLIGFLGGHNIS